MSREVYHINERRYAKMKDLIKDGKWKVDSFTFVDPDTGEEKPVDHRKDKTIGFCIGYTDPSSFCRAKKGNDGIALDKLMKLGNVLKCNWQYLCGKSDIMEKPTEGQIFNERLQKSHVEYERRMKEPGACSATLKRLHGKEIITTIQVMANNATLDDVIKEALRYPGGFEAILEALKAYTNIKLYDI